MSTVLIAAITGVAMVVGSFVTWRIARRTTSGAVETSQASDLWAEGGKIRSELRVDLTETKQQLEDTSAALREAVAAITALNEEIRRSREETEAAREEYRLSRQETRELKTQITELTAQITELHRTQVTALAEVSTHNSLTLGGMADNDETRRILAVPKADRTPHEEDHLRTAPERLPDNLAASQGSDDE